MLILTEPPSDYVATINWGDGTSSAGTIVKDKNGGFDVLGSHTFTAPGAFSVQTQIRDGGLGVTSPQYYTSSSLVSDGAVPADNTDPNLLNPWGIVHGGGGPFWVSDNNAGVTTLYDGAGNVIPAVFTIPPPTRQTGTAASTGVVFNGNDKEFLVNGPGTSAFFSFATEDGTISAWDGGSSAVLKVDNSQKPTPADGAVYKGLSLVTIPAGNLLPAGDYLFATNFRSGKIDVFDSSFNPVKLPAGAFQDPTIPAGYAPFGIQLMNGSLYVTYAQQNAAKHDDVEGPGHGFVDVYNVGGFFTQRIGGTGFQPELNSPWGLVTAPSNFGKFSNDLLVGNFGDSHVNAFDPVSGAFLGQLSDAHGHPLVLTGGFKGSSTKGLWRLEFGNDGAAGSSTTLFFTAGINDEQDGLLGSLTATSYSTATASSIAFVNPSLKSAFGITSGGLDSTSPQAIGVLAGDLSSVLTPAKKARDNHANLDAALGAIGNG